MRQITPRSWPGLLLIVLSSTVAAAQPNDDSPDLHRLDVYVTRVDVEEMAAALNTSPAQRKVIESHFAEYRKKLIALHEELVDAIEATEREIWGDRDPGTKYVPRSKRNPDKWRESHTRVVTLIKEAIRSSDRLYDTFFAEVEPVLTDEQVAQLEGVHRSIRYESYRRLRRSTDGFRVPMLTDVFSEALDHEFAPLVDDAPPDDRALSYRRALEEMRRAIESMKANVDAALQQRIESAREPLDPDAPIRMYPGTKEYEDLVRRRTDRFRDYDGPTHDAFMQIALTAETALDVPARRAWEQRYWDAALGRFMPELYFDGAVEWLKQRDDATPGQLDVLERLHRDRGRAMHGSIGHLYETGRASMRHSGSMRGNSRHHRQFLAARLRTMEINHEYLQKFAALLYPPQREQWDDGLNKLVLQTGWFHFYLRFDEDSLSDAGLLERYESVREHYVPRPPSEEELLEWIEELRQKREQEQSGDSKAPSEDASEARPHQQ